MAVLEPTTEDAGLDSGADRAPREVRLGVVLYGGVSLAVYIAGVARELYELVSATADGAQPAPGSTGELYRQIARPADPAGGGVPTRYVIDVISGSSAGGINGIVLAKALVTGAGVASLGPLWRDMADIATLLARPKAGVALEGLLDGSILQDSLREVLRSMDEHTGRGLVEELDLWITTTDLNGVATPLHAAGLQGSIREARHAHVLRFRHVPNESHFVADYNGLLAFAGRATSSFPLAFEPARLRDTLLNPRQEADGGLSFSGHLFPDHPFGELPKWSWGDGGDIDNMPWSYVLRTVEDRRSLGWVERTLLFVEPDPHVPAEGPPAGLSPLKAAWRAFNLGRAETIRQDIESIDRYNRRVGALLDTLDTVDKAIQARVVPLWREVAAQQPDTDWSYLRYDVDAIGTSYAAYHELKVADLLRELARWLHVGWPEGRGSFKPFAQRWKERRYGPTIRWKDMIDLDDGARPSENGLLRDFDLAYRLRRLSFIARILTELQRDSGGAAARYRRFLDEHGLPAAAASAAGLEPLLDACNRSRLALLDLGREVERRSRTELALLSPDAGDDEKQQWFDKALDALRELSRPSLIAIAAAIEEVLPRAATHAGPVTAQDSLARFVRELWDDYESYDEQLFGLAVFGTAELAPINVFRLSPLDTHSMEPSTGRLGGTRLGHFGGLFDRKLRRADLLWGRLDAAERLLDVLGVASDQRSGLLEEFQRRIIEQENRAMPPGDDGSKLLVPPAADPVAALHGLLPLTPEVGRNDIESIVGAAGAAAGSVVDSLAMVDGRERLVAWTYRLLRHWHTAGRLVYGLGAAGVVMLVATATAAGTRSDRATGGALAAGAGVAALTAAVSAWRGVGPPRTLPWARRGLLGAAALFAVLALAVLWSSQPVLLGVTAAACAVAAMVALLAFAIIAALQLGSRLAVRWVGAKVATGLGVANDAAAPGGEVGSDRRST